MNDEREWITCPCCGYRTIGEEYEICRVCFWEHDTAQARDPDMTGANGHVTLRMAQQNFARFGACDKVFLDSVQKPSADHVRDPDWKPLPPSGDTRPSWSQGEGAETKWMTCPCCGYRTITEEYDLCEICFWAHDISQARDPDRKGANGHLTLRMAQQNFARFGACEKAAMDHVRKPTDDDARDPDWEPLPYEDFERMFITCPCCGYKTIKKEYDICEFCFWTYDISQVRDPDITGANHLTLRMAQQNFASFGAYDESVRELVCKPTADDVRDPDWEPLPPKVRDG